MITNQTIEQLYVICIFSSVSFNLSTFVHKLYIIAKKERESTLISQAIISQQSLSRYHHRLYYSIVIDSREEINETNVTYVMSTQFRMLEKISRPSTRMQQKANEAGSPARCVSLLPRVIPSTTYVPTSIT